MATLANTFEIMRTFITQPPVVIVTLCEHGVLRGHHKETQSAVQCYLRPADAARAPPAARRRFWKATEVPVLCSFMLATPLRVAVETVWMDSELGALAPASFYLDATTKLRRLLSQKVCQKESARGG